MMDMPSFSSGAAALIALLCVPPLAAQAPAAVCTDRTGAPVPLVVDDSMDSAGMAGYAGNTQPTIWWNETLLEHTSRVEQLFIFMHECGHLTLNHAWKSPSLRNEIEADCWAVQLMVEGGMIAPSEWDSLLVARARVRPDRQHLGGSEHVTSLRRCLTVRTDPAAWDSALPPLVAAARTRFTGIRGLELEPAPGQHGRVWESTLDLPGTYSCEILGTERLRCMVYTSTHVRAVANRYRALVDILTGWMPAGWEAAEELAPGPGGARSFRARDTATGTTLSLLLGADPKVYFVVTAPAN